MCRPQPVCLSSIPSLHSQSLLHRQQLRDKNSEKCQQILCGFRNKRCQENDCWTRTTLTGVSKKRKKAPSARTPKVVLNEILYYSRESWYEPFEKYVSQSPAGFEIFKTVATL